MHFTWYPPKELQKYFLETELEKGSLKLSLEKITLKGREEAMGKEKHKNKFK